MRDTSCAQTLVDALLCWTLHSQRMVRCSTVFKDVPASSILGACPLLPQTCSEPKMSPNPAIFIICTASPPLSCVVGGVYAVKPGTWIRHCLIQGGPKKVSIHSLQLRQILADFQNSFTVTFSRKFAIKQSLNIPPDFKRVAALPCEIFMS